MDAVPSDWVSYWDSDHPIFANARHRDVHYRLIADELATYIPVAGMVVLDYGCGEALYADRIADRSGRLLLADAAPKLRAALNARYAGDGRISVLNVNDVAALGDQSVDVILMQSLVQYLTKDELTLLLGRFRRLLKPPGRLIVGDVVGPDTSPLTDVYWLLRFGAANGFLLAALHGVVKTMFSNYLRVRTSLGFSFYGATDMIGLLRKAGFDAERARHNIGHNQSRMTFVARTVEAPR